MSSAEEMELVESFEQFFKNYYDEEIKQLAQKYPNEQRSLPLTGWTCISSTRIC